MNCLYTIVGALLPNVGNHEVNLKEDATVPLRITHSGLISASPTLQLSPHPLISICRDATGAI